MVSRWFLSALLCVGFGEAAIANKPNELSLERKKLAKNRDLQRSQQRFHKSNEDALPQQLAELAIATQQSTLALQNVIQDLLSDTFYSSENIAQKRKASAKKRALQRDNQRRLKHDDALLQFKSELAIITQQQAFECAETQQENN